MSTIRILLILLFLGSCSGTEQAPTDIAKATSSSTWRGDFMGYEVELTDIYASGGFTLDMEEGWMETLNHSEFAICVFKFSVGMEHGSLAHEQSNESPQSPFHAESQQGRLDFVRILEAAHNKSGSVGTALKRNKSEEPVLMTVEATAVDAAKYEVFGKIKFSASLKR